MSKRIFTKLTIFAVILAVVVPPVGLFAAQKLTYAVWIPYWRKTTGVPDALAHLDQLQEISPFSYEVRSDGTITDPMKLDKDPWPALLATAKAKKVKVLPSVLWTDGVAMDTILANTTKRAGHIKQIIALVDKYNFSGIDIDYEGKKVSTINYFSQFLTTLSTQLHAKGKILSCTIEARIPPSSLYVTMPKKIEYANDYTVINRVCDEVRLMTYDQGSVDIKLNMLKRRGGLYAPIADNDWVRKVLSLTTQTISAKKIMVGIATYGVEYEITDKTKFFDYKKVRSLAYVDAMALAKQVNAKIFRNSAGEMNFTYATGTSSRFVSFTDAQSVADKIKIAEVYGVRGVAVFRVDGLSDPAIWGKIR